MSKSIVKALSEHIISQNLKPGDRLPTEMELAEQFHVARTVAREALKSIETLGMIVSKPGVGSVLTSGGIEPFLIPFVFGMVFDDAGLSKLGELRLIVEHGAVQLAIKNASMEEKLTLMQMAKELDKVKARAYDDLTELNQSLLAEKETEFHQYLVQISHNPILQKFSSLWRIFFIRAKANQSFEDTSKSYKNRTVPTALHVEIAEALLVGDQAKALAKVEDHMAYWLKQDKWMEGDVLIDMVRSRFMKVNSTRSVKSVIGN